MIFNNVQSLWTRTSPIRHRSVDLSRAPSIRLFDILPQRPVESSKVLVIKTTPKSQNIVKSHVTSVCDININESGNYYKHVHTLGQDATSSVSLRCTCLQQTYLHIFIRHVFVILERHHLTHVYSSIRFCHGSLRLDQRNVPINRRTSSTLFYQITSISTTLSKISY